MAATFVDRVPRYAPSGGGLGVRLSKGEDKDLSFNNKIELGTGSFGYVYQARYQEESCVIKIGTAQDVMMREIQSYKRLSDNKSVASMKTYGQFKTKGVSYYFLVLEQGTDFNQYATEQNLHNRSFEMKQYAAKRVLQMVSGFHDSGQLHNDIKSTNIIIISKSKKLKGKFIDLDRVSRIKDDVYGCIPGTCAPPEQLDRWSLAENRYIGDFPEGYDPRLIDSFATGCMLALKLYGQYPFEYDFKKGDIYGAIAKMSVEAHEALLGECDDPLWGIILALTHPDWTQRITVDIALARVEALS